MTVALNSLPNSRVTASRKKLLQKAAESLASVPGHTHRVIRTRFIRSTLTESKQGITPLHQEILRLLEEEGTLHCAEIGRRLQIAKAQMTKLIDRLVVLQIVERKTDTEDRRVLNISITEKGKTLLKEHKANFRNAIETAMTSLTDNELEELSTSIRNIHDILSRLE
jgi:DNA-binding MarR family transcriptional regulator